MINRTLVRTKVVQNLFAYGSNEGKTRLTTEKELLSAFSDTYNLYFLLLDLVNELTSYAQQKMDEAQERAVAMHQDYNANPRFVNNRFAQQLFENRTLRHYLTEGKLCWDVAHDALAPLYKQITESDFYGAYMSSDDVSYEADKAVWRKIFCHVLAGNEQLESALEELEVSLDGKNWTTDADIIISYVVKTIKRFREENGSDQALLEMFDTEAELGFGKKLLRNAIEHSEEYEKLISGSLKNWDAERIAYMDMVILKVAIAELMSFPDIALQVTFNEYIEIAREYSSESSPQFVNGVLDEVVRRLKQENRLLKAVVLD